MSLTQGYVHIYTGDGKGKTTASLGLCFRALGAGLKVIVFQFIKRRRCSEHSYADKIGLKIVQPALDCAVYEANKALYEQVCNSLASGTYELVVVDELGEAMRRGYVSRAEVEALVQLKPPCCELVFTGRNLIGRIDDLADLVSEIRAHKHYFDQGVMAREGIEY